MTRSFECKEEYQVALSRLGEFTAGKESGFLLMYSDVGKLTGYARGTYAFDYLLRTRFVAEMRNRRQIVLQAIPNIGYRFMTPEEVVRERTVLRVRKSRNQLRIGSKELQTATSDLSKIESLQGRRLAVSMESYLKEKKNDINAALRQLKKTDTIPVRKPL